VLLTETFSTGFSMTPGIGEPEGGPSAQFLAGQAAEHGVWVGGTCPEIADGHGKDAALPYNSFVLAGPDGTTHRYRKLHPFTHAGEHERFRAGEKPTTVEIGGLRVTPFICYDLRFANVFWDAAPATDVYLVPANWPSPRRHHWQTLLQARAIENQAYVVGVNRVGRDGNGVEHAGDSRIVSPMGELLATAAGVETVVLADVDAAGVAATREKFAFLPDRRA
jgi:predicted amidohydrolase